MEFIPLPGPFARNGAFLDQTLNKGPLLLPGSRVAAEGCKVSRLLVYGLTNERCLRHSEITRQLL